MKDESVQNTVNCKRIKHHVQEYPAMRYLESDNPETRSWAFAHQEELNSLDKEHQSLRRWTNEHQDDRELDDVERKSGYTSAGRKKGQLGRPETIWLDQTFENNPEELHQLVHSNSLAKVIQMLTPHQRKILHMSAIQEMKTREIAELLGTTSRNILELLDRTYKKLRIAVKDSRGEGTVGTCARLLGWLIIPNFMIGWQVAKRVYPQIKTKVLRMAA